MAPYEASRYWLCNDLPRANVRQFAGVIGVAPQLPTVGRREPLVAPRWAAILTGASAEVAAQKTTTRSVARTLSLLAAFF